MRRLSELEKVEIWDRFEAGESQRSTSCVEQPRWLHG